MPLSLSNLRYRKTDGYDGLAGGQDLIEVKIGS